MFVTACVEVSWHISSTNWFVSVGLKGSWFWSWVMRSCRKSFWLSVLLLEVELLLDDVAADDEVTLVVLTGCVTMVPSFYANTSRNSPNPSSTWGVD